jgi:hypothetical protein
MEIISNPVELAKKLVSIRSESGNEKEVAPRVRAGFLCVLISSAA